MTFWGYAFVVTALVVCGFVSFVIGYAKAQVYCESLIKVALQIHHSEVTHEILLCLAGKQTPSELKTRLHYMAAGQEHKEDNLYLN